MLEYAKYVLRIIHCITCYNIHFLPDKMNCILDTVEVCISDYAKSF